MEGSIVVYWGNNHPYKLSFNKTSYTPSIILQSPCQGDSGPRLNSIDFFMVWFDGEKQHGLVFFGKMCVSLRWMVGLGSNILAYLIGHFLQNGYGGFLKRGTQFRLGFWIISMKIFLEGFYPKMCPE